MKRVGKLFRHKTHGFTIVELLIVIVIIGILAGLVITTFTGVQAKARDAQRKTDVTAITKALEAYYSVNGKYPSGSGSTTINASWSTTADSSWDNLTVLLQPYMNTKIQDPVSSPAKAAISGGFNYDYFSNSTVGTTYCGAGQNQMFLLVYRLEAGAQVNTLSGSCATMVLGPYANASNIRTSP